MGFFRDLKYGQVVLGNKSTSFDEEPVFVLRAQDRLAPFVIDAYVREANNRGLDDVAHEALKSAEKFRKWQERFPQATKLPD